MTLLLLFNAGLINTCSLEARRFIADVLDKRENAKARYLVDSHFVATYGMNHEAYDIYESVRRYWVAVFEEPKEMPYGGNKPRNIQKGYIVLPLGEYNVERGHYDQTHL